MTALAGIWAFSESAEPERAVLGMIEAQAGYGPHGRAVARLGSVAFGRSLYRILPEDRFDRQPMIDSASATMMVADVRLDNRSELLANLGLPAGELLSDAGLLFRAYLEWRGGVLDRLLGDFAFAVWDGDAEALVLVRDTAGQRPLHFRANEAGIAFASMPRGLGTRAPLRLDEGQLADFVADVPRDDGATFFEGVRRVGPGQCITLRRSAQSVRHYFRRPERELNFPREEDYLEAFRAELDRATRVRLRGAEAGVGAHLSAGLDSSAVAATAARLLAPDGKVTAFTAAPRAGFTGAVLAPRIGDESKLAGLVAARYPNMEHVIVRSGDVSPLDILGRDDALFEEPVGHPCNFVWWSAVHDEARARRLSVMLTGEAGNLTISAGALPMLTEFVRKGQWLRWWRTARAIAGKGPSWRGVMATSFGPWFPRWAWGLVTRTFVGGGPSDAFALLHPSIRARIEAKAAREARGGRPEKDNMKMRWEQLSRHEPGNFRKGILARWGIDERDPTADRRLVEFCFSVPTELLIGGGMTRRLARVALADRLPAELLHGPRGYQYADWYERIDREGLTAAVDALARNEAASRLLDIGRLRDVVDRWPTEGWHELRVIAEYRMAFLMALSAGHFAASMAGSDAGPRGERTVASSEGSG